MQSDRGQNMKRLTPTLLAVFTLLLGCEPKVSPGIEGKWVMPKGGFMRYALALGPSGSYTRWFWSDVVGDEIPENPKHGTYAFSGGWITIPVTERYRDGKSYVFDDRFKRETVNDVEILLREDSEKIWRRTGMIYTGGLLIKVSDDPQYLDSDSEPRTEKLFRNGVKEWSAEAEAAARK